MWARMQQRWGVGPWQAVVILLVFALTGSATVKVTAPITNALLSDDMPRWQWWTFRILIITPIYQVLLLFFGTVFGQFRFFWEKEKALGRLIIRLFRGRRS